MNLKRALVIVGVLGAVVAASAALPTLRGIGGGTDDEVPTYIVERGDFVREIHADGNLKAADATLLGPPPEHRRPLKIAWLFPDGSYVRAGDVVIRFDPTDLEEELQEGRHDRATTDSQITSKQVREEGSRHNLERDAEVAALELDYAQSFQSKDAMIFSRREIIESEIDEKLAHQKKEHAQLAGDLHHELVRTELDLLGIERRKAELKISQAAEALEALEVRAPHDGIFVLKQVWGRKPEVGQTVWGGNAVAEIPKPEKMESQVYVLEADAGGLEVGLPATVLLDAQPDVVYKATASQVAALAQRRNHRSPVQYFSVTLELERTDTAVMKPGQRVSAVLTLDERQDVLTVPRQTVFEDEGKKIVYVRRGGGFEPTEVELGPSALGRLVIDAGLEEGDRIALRDPTRPADEPDDGDQGGEASPTPPSESRRTIMVIG
jgi:multidrug efflux pump subunit AcrA (membrane-fusion protein)